MVNVLETIALLEQKLEVLIEKYQFLEQENDLLGKNNFKLQQLNRDLVEQNKELLSQNEAMKISKSFTGSEDYTGSTKQKIDILVNEIDQCIELMKR